MGYTIAANEIAKITLSGLPRNAQRRRCLLDVGRFPHSLRTLSLR